MIVTRTPLRISFVGGGSDLPAYYNCNQGAVLSTTVNKYIYISVNKKFDDNIRLSYSITENEKFVKNIKHPIVKNILKFLKINNQIEISSISDIPSKGSGLGSSSSFTVGLTKALYSFLEREITKSDLAKFSSFVEINLCGEKIGKQDQYAAAYGGFNIIEFNKNEKVKVTPIVCKKRTIRQIEKSLIVFFTGMQRRSNDILSRQSKNLRKTQNKKIISNMVNLVYELKREIENDNILEFGEILDKNWNLKKQLASNISSFELDELYSKGIKAGATGGKILGAGNGGFLMFFANPKNHKDIIKALPKLKKVDFKFEKDGSKVVYCGK